MSGQQWYESPKGYTTRADGVSMVVFWDTRSRGWKHVCDGEFSDVFHTLPDALDSAEERLGIKGMVGRFRCRDVPPHLRDQAPRETARSFGSGAAGAGTRFRGRRPGVAPPHPEPTQARIDELITPLFRAPVAPGAAEPAGKTRVQLMIEANLARRQPPWARFLGLKGAPPYTAQQVKDAFRAAAKLVHPDAGGRDDIMAKLNIAYEEGLAAVAPAAPQPAPEPAPVPAARPAPCCDFCRKPMTKQTNGPWVGRWICENVSCEPPF